MVFRREKQNVLAIIGLYVDDIEIKGSPTMKFLELIIDKKLNLVNHITYVIK